ncbi:G protein alpha q isoform 2, partial [Reticulomyxa filosa]
VLFEDSTMNRMQEEFSLFRSTIKHPTFEGMSLIVLLNKWDQLEEKISYSPFSFSFEDYQYKGDKSNPSDVVTYVQDTLQSIAKHNRLYFNVLTATSLFYDQTFVQSYIHYSLVLFGLI